MSRSAYLDGLTRQERDTLIRRLHAQQAERCFISADEIDLSQHEVDLDHIIALARGGQDCEANIALVLAHHNRSKGVRDLELQRRIFAFIRDLGQHEKSDPKNPLLTVGHVLAKKRADGRQLTLTWVQDIAVRLAWTTALGEPRTLELPLIVDAGARELVRTSCFGRLAPEILHHSDLNPRSIHDLEPMIEEFYLQRPQMQPSLAYFEPTQAGSSVGRIMLFDGQHKAAAQLYNGADGLLCRVFLPHSSLNAEKFQEFVDELRRTNFRAHTKLAQLHFAQFTEDKVGHTLYADKREEVSREVKGQGSEEKDISEEKLYKTLKEANPDEAKELKAQHSSYLRYEVLTSKELELVKFVETVSARSRRYPISYDTFKALLDTFLFSSFADEPLGTTEPQRLAERDNLARLLDVLAEEALTGQFKLDLGIYKLDEKIETDPHSVPVAHLRAYRLFRKPAVSVWAEVLRDAISHYLVIRGKSAKAWHKDRPLWAEIDSEGWLVIRRAIKAVLSHKVWIDTSKHLIGRLASTRKKDWESVLLEGRLPGSPDKLYPPLDTGAVVKAMTQT
jgi:hypothetical protein